MNWIKKNRPLAILGAFALVPTLGLTAAVASATPAFAAGISVSISDSQNPTVPYESSKFVAFASTDCGTITTYHWVGGDDTLNPHDVVSTRQWWEAVGSHTVTVTVADSCGNSKITTVNHSVVASTVPIAEFTTRIDTINPLQVYADPSGSHSTT